MSKIRFNLREANAKNETLIVLMYNYDKGKRLRMSTGLSIKPKHWNDKQHTARISDECDHSKINARLSELKRIVEDLYKKYEEDGFFPSPKIFKEQVLNANENPIKRKSEMNFWDHFEKFVDEKRAIVKNGDVRDYHNSLRKHLLVVQKKMDTQLTFQTINPRNTEFHKIWTSYLTNEAINSFGEQGLLVNSIGKINKLLRALLNWSFRNSVTESFDLSHFPPITEDVQTIYLSKSDLKKLENINLEGIQDEVRDLFLVGCETALRFSDYSRITRSHLNIEEEELQIRPKKTEGKVLNNNLHIPFSPRLHKILLKYNYELPNFNSNSVTKFNSILREICKKAEINDDVIIVRKIDNKIIEYTKKKFEMVYSHTARRTFCTLRYLEGFDTILIRNISGHSSEKNFMRYLRIDKKASAELFRRKMKELYE